MLSEERQSLMDEACGVCAHVSRVPTSVSACVPVLYGLAALQHRGQESAGIVWHDCGSEHLHERKTQGLVGQLVALMPSVCDANVAVGHVRYSTSGVGDVLEAQPLMMDSQFGPLVLAHNGHITNADVLRTQLVARGAEFITATDSEVILQGVAWDDAEDFEQALCNVLRGLEGAFSIVLYAPKHGLFASRDPHGVRPLLLATGDEGYAVASETCALTNVAALKVRELLPGEVVCLRAQEIPRSLWPHKPVERASCLFELVYFAHERSHVFSHDVRMVRRAFGEELGRECPAAHADLVIHVPQSSHPAAEGYASVLGIPHVSALTRRTGVGRTFLAPTQAEREAMVRAKFSLDRDAVRGKRVVVVDDSLVRGTTARGIVTLLREADVAEIHLRIASPPIIKPCHYGIDTPDVNELVAAKQARAELAQELGVHSLEYLSVEGMYRAVHTRTGFCDACFTGTERL